MSANAKSVIDENGTRYSIGKILGQGGQGRTYLVNDPAILVKCSFAHQSDEEYRAAVQYVRALPLPESLPIAKPVYLLRPPLHGYVMRMMTNMTDMNSIVCGFEEAPLDKKLEYYIATGGMRRRLRILRNLAAIFYQFRIRNLVYCDLSYANVFISKAVEESTVWLIDADNLRYASDIVTQFGTPECRAPELFYSCNSVYADMYSFALVSYLFLTGVKPFFGRIVSQKLVYNEEEHQESGMKEDDWGIEDDWDADEEANDDQAAEGKSQKIPENQFDCAEQGFLPWIDDPDNQDNRNDNVGIRRIVIDERIFECFQQTFSYEGRKHPETRPHPAKWFRAFLQAEKRTVDCPCGWSYYYETGNCPCCGKPLSPLFLAVTYELHTDAEGEDFRTECSRRVISFGKTTELCASDLLPLPTAKLIERDTVYFELADSKKQNDRWMITQKTELICELTESGKSYDGSLTLKLQLQTLDTLRIRLTVGNRVRVVEFQMYQP